MASKEMFDRNQLSLIRQSLEKEIKSLTMQAAKAVRPQFKEIFQAEKSSLEKLLVHVKELENAQVG